jgi:hypothetical protein
MTHNTPPPAEVDINAVYQKGVDWITQNAKRWENLEPNVLNQVAGELDQFMAGLLGPQSAKHSLTKLPDPRTLLRVSEKLPSVADSARVIINSRLRIIVNARIQTFQEASMPERVRQASEAALLAQ